MSFWTSVQSFFVTTETDVLNLISQIKQGLAVVESDVTAALKWIANNTPQIVADLQQVVGIAETIGIAANPNVAAAITAANAAVTALNAFAAASNNGATNTQAVLAGYTAVKQAQAAAASAAAAVTAPTPSKTS